MHLASGRPGAGAYKFKPLKQGSLRHVDLLVSGSQIEPPRAIDLRKLSGSSAARRPLNLERIAVRGLCVQVRFYGKRRDDLAATLPNLRQRR